MNPLVVASPLIRGIGTLASRGRPAVVRTDRQPRRSGEIVTDFIKRAFGVNRPPSWERSRKPKTGRARRRVGRNTNASDLVASARAKG